jgi:nucleoside-diphosphate-sugar epimerase
LNEQRKYVVTGGGGFVGKALCRRLLQDGHQVTAVARGEYPDLQGLGVDCRRVDISSDEQGLLAAFSGAAAVFHVAAKVDMWGHYRDFLAVNVYGTRNVLTACRAAKVPVLVYTSSPSVIANGSNLRGVDESYPYPEQHSAYYPATKAMAEREVLAAHKEDGLRTISLRPHLIFGPGDRNFVPTICRKAKAGRLVRVGAGTNLVDICFIDDCVEAHLRAAEVLEREAGAGGKAYFISQGEPVLLWDWIDEVLRFNNLPPVQRSIPARVAIFAGRIAEAFCRIIPGHPEPPFTAFLAEEMATDHYFDISAAKRNLDWTPGRSVAEAMEITFGSL